MRPIAIEALLITEHGNGLASIAVNEGLLGPLSPEEQDQFMRSIFKLSRSWLLKDLEQVGGHEKISPSIDPVHKDFVMQIRGLVTPVGDFSLLTYFGGLANPETRLHDGILHALQVVATCENGS